MAGGARRGAGRATPPCCCRAARFRGGRLGGQARACSSAGWPRCRRCRRGCWPFLGFSRAYLADTEKGSRRAWSRRWRWRSGPVCRPPSAEAYLRRGRAAIRSAEPAGRRGGLCPGGRRSGGRGSGWPARPGVALLALGRETGCSGWASGTTRSGAVAQAWQLETDRRRGARGPAGPLPARRGSGAGSAPPSMNLAAVELLTGSSAGPRHRLPLLVLRAGLEMWRSTPPTSRSATSRRASTWSSWRRWDIWLVAPLLWHGTRGWAEDPATRAAAPVGRADPAAAGALRRAGAPQRRHGGPRSGRWFATYAAMCARRDGQGPRAGPTRRLGRRVCAGCWSRRDQPYPRRVRPAAGGPKALCSPSAPGRRRRPRSCWPRRARRARGLGAVPFARGDHRPGPPRPGPARTRRTPTTSTSRCRGGAPSPPWNALTARELEVLTELASGLTNRQIRPAGCSSAEKTVGVHVQPDLRQDRWCTGPGAGPGARCCTGGAAVRRRVRRRLTPPRNSSRSWRRGPGPGRPDSCRTGMPVRPCELPRSRAGCRRTART